MAGATVNLNDEPTNIDTSNDSIVIVDVLMAKRGGTTLDVTGFSPDILKSGLLIIKETATKIYKPMPLNGGATAYAALPADHTYAGILIATIKKAQPFAAVLEAGKVNEAAAPFAYPAGAKTALNLILFTQD